MGWRCKGFGNRPGTCAAPGATLLFGGETWESRPIRPVRRDEYGDVWFLVDQLRAGAVSLAVDGLEQYLAVRHQGAGHGRGHIWTNDAGSETLEQHLAMRRLVPGGPEGLLPDWALASHRELRATLLASPPAVNTGRARPNAEPSE